MICPFTATWKLRQNTMDNWGLNCIKEQCAWWDSQVNFNPETKQFQGQCCILTLSRLKISGGINAHTY